MRVNPRVFEVVGDATPLDTQEFDNRKIEIYKMDDYEAVKEEFINNKGKFAVWSSVDGVNYRIFIESGYYETLKELYTPAVNKIWVDFWDVCEKTSKKTSMYMILPLTLIAVVLCILFQFVIPKEYSTYAMLAVVVVAFVGMLFFNRLTKKKIYDENVKSVELIKKSVGGAKNFDDLLDKQKDYIDKYYAALYPEVEEDEENLEVLETENKDEALEQTLEDKQEVLEDKNTDEVEVVEDNIPKESKEDE